MADVVKEFPHLEILQMASFGCGLDAITTDAVEEILEEDNQLYTWIKWMKSVILVPHVLTSFT